MRLLLQAPDILLVCLILLLYHIVAEGAWTPRDCFWKHYEQTQEGLCAWLNDENDEEEGVDAFDVIPDCLFDTLAQEGIFESILAESNNPQVVRGLRDPVTNQTLAVEIQDAISPLQARAVQVLADCARRVVPNRFEIRTFSGGGNDCTYLNTLLPLFLPTVAATVQHTAEVAFDAANWSQYEMMPWNGTFPIKFPPPGELGVRSTEHLAYKTIKNIGGHRDHYSIYTVVFTLSDSYEGGEFFIRRGKYGLEIKPAKFSAVVFLSEETHGVRQVTSGVRETFATEYWPFDDTPWDEWRPSGPEVMELFTKRMEGVENFASIATEWMWPTKEELEAYLVETGRDEISGEGYGDEKDDEDYEDD